MMFFSLALRKVYKGRIKEGGQSGVGQLGVPGGLITRRSVVQIHTPLSGGILGCADSDDFVNWRTIFTE
jgi:hypothetical protein